MTRVHRLRKRLATFAANQDGVVSAYAVITLIALLALGGYAVDVSNVMSRRTHLQITSDAVAHTALVEREFNSSDLAKAAAVNMSIANLPVDYVGTVVRKADILFGDWDKATNLFAPRAASRSAVHVTARENTENGNPIATYMLKIVGFDNWDVTTVSVFETYRPTCLQEGFVAEQPVDVQSNNMFRNGFCIHSNTGVKLSGGNTFEPGTVVSMADLAALQIPNSGYTSNTGLREALREGSWNIRIVSRVNKVIAGIQDPESQFYPEYLTSPIALTLTNRTIKAGDLTPGRIHKLTCSNNQDMRFDTAFTMSKVVIITNCDVRFTQGVTLEDSVIATTSTSSQSITSAADFQLGKTDNCILGGESQLVTMGSIKLTSKISIYGSQLLAVGDISFTALGEGSRGVQMVAGGTISGTSNMDMGACGNMADANFQLDYFRLVH